MYEQSDVSLDTDKTTRFHSLCIHYTFRIIFKKRTLNVHTCTSWCTLMYITLNERSYMRTYTVAKFRINTKEALDHALNGEQVYIERLGQMFQLVPSSVNIKQNNDGTISPRDPEQPTIIQQHTPVGPNEFKEIVEHAPPKDEFEEIDLEMPCCKKSTPCRHWMFNHDSLQWKNTLSSRIREPEL